MGSTVESDDGAERRSWAKDLRGAGPETLSDVRAWARGVLPDLGRDHLADVLIVAVELVTNALDHGGGPELIRLTRSRRPCVVAVEVEDSNTATLTPGVSRFGEAGHRGHGLVMIANVARDWGVRCDEPAGRKTVWTEVGCAESPCAPPSAADVVDSARRPDAKTTRRRRDDHGAVRRPGRRSTGHRPGHLGGARRAG